VPKKLRDQFIRLAKEDRLYQLNAPIVGVTGGVATGKSTASNFLEQMGFAIICADQLVKQVYQTTATKEYLTTNLPQTINSGQIDFALLRSLAFKDQSILIKLEGVIYPQMEEQFLAAYQTLNSPPLVIYDVPLLFEKRLHSKVDLSICVYANQEQQIERLVQRDQIKEVDARLMLKQQMPIEEKRQLAEFTINNSGKPQNLHLAIEALVEQITEDC
jgi:dephospho-CoA kinase